MVEEAAAVELVDAEVQAVEAVPVAVEKVDEGIQVDLVGPGPVVTPFKIIRRRTKPGCHKIRKYSFVFWLGGGPLCCRVQKKICLPSFIP